MSLTLNQCNYYYRENICDSVSYTQMTTPSSLTGSFIQESHEAPADPVTEESKYVNVAPTYEPIDVLLISSDTKQQPGAPNVYATYDVPRKR